MTYQRCLATHTGNPPEAHAGLRLCTADYDRLTDALTGPAAASDLTVEAVWGYVDGAAVIVCADRQRAIDSRERAYRTYSDRLSVYNARYTPETIVPAPRVVGPVACGDGTHWYDPRHYRPGGLARDWSALQLRDKSIRTGDPAPYVSNGATEAPLPIDPAVADIRLRITHALTYWVQQHIQLRKLTQPPLGALGTVYQVTTWLARHNSWAAAQDWAGTYADNLRELRAQARSIIDLPQPRTFDVGPCICIVDGHRCPGTLRTIARDARDPVPPVIQCSDCHAAYDATRWKRLGERLYGKTA